jgi:hypothetical protein
MQTEYQILTRGGMQWHLLGRQCPFQPLIFYDT